MGCDWVGARGWWCETSLELAEEGREPRRAQAVKWEAEGRRVGARSMRGGGIDWVKGWADSGSEIHGRGGRLPCPLLDLG